MTHTAPYIVLAAGGTGGHMMPADAVADELMAAGYEVFLITDKRGNAIGNALGEVERHVLSATSHATGGLIGKIRAAVSTLQSTLAVRRLFKKRRPCVVVGFGGYPSLPAILAARSLRIPFVLHEQNAVLGRVNRLMAEKAEMIALSVEATQRVPAWAHTQVTGNPVRKIIAKMANIAYAVPLGFGDIRLFILGGSQGARILSDVVPAAVANLSDDDRARLDVLHQARPEDIDRVVAAYAAAGVRARVQSYFDDVGAILLRTQLVVCRSGASTLAELTAMGRPAIMVPLAIAADDHQTANARLVADVGGGWVIEEKDFTVEALGRQLSFLFGDIGQLRDASEGMRELGRVDAARNLAEVIVHVCESEVRA